MKKPHAHLQTDIKMCEKFQKDQPKTVRGVELTRKQCRNGYQNVQMEIPPKVGKLMFCMSSHSALHLCEEELRSQDT